jgi:hypothetical protein
MGFGWQGAVGGCLACELDERAMRFGGRGVRCDG